MDCHELDPIRIFLIVKVRVKGNVLKIFLKCDIILLVFLFIVLDGIHQLGNILKAFFVTICPVQIIESALVQHIIQQIGYCHPGLPAPTFFDKLHKP